MVPRYERQCGERGLGSKAVLIVLSGYYGERFVRGIEHV